MATILVSDYLSSNREVLIRLLRSRGHRMLEAADGGEALAIVHSEHPELVITDVLMPVMDGYELLRQLRLNQTTRGIRVVFCTSPDREPDARAFGASSGVSFVLTKPVVPEAALDIIERALAGETDTAARHGGSPPGAANEGRTFTVAEEALVTALSGQIGRIDENGSLSAVARDRDRVQRYLDTAQVILLALDVEGRITQINQYGCSLLGWTADALLGRDWVETCLPPRVRDPFKRKFHNLLDGDLSFVENPILTRSGDERLIEWRNTVLRDGTGNVIGTFSSGADITERRRAETQVRLQSAALNAAANAMVITDRAGLIEWTNPAFSDLTGYTAAEALSRNPRDLVKSDHHDRAFYEDLWKTILSGQVWRGEMINRRKDHSLYTEEQTITPLRDAHGEISHFIAVKQDVTERKRAEEEIHQRARLSALGAAVGLSLTTITSLGPALQRCAEAIVTHLGAAFARIWTFNERDGVLELQASAGLYTHLDGSHGRIPFGEFKIGRIARDRKPHLTNSVIGDPEINDQEWARREGMVAFAGHPLIVEGRVVGVIALFSRQTLSEAALFGLASVADHVALGIERRRNAEGLRIAEERMRFALENAGVGIWDMDYTTGVLQWSETLEAQYGLQPGTFGGTFEAFVDRIHPDDRAAVLETIDRAMKSSADFALLHRTVWPDGSVRWLSGAGRIHTSEQGQPLRGVGISQDVTERQRADAELKHLNDQIQRQRLQVFKATMRTVQDIVNNLLNGLQLVQAEAEGQPSGETQALVDQVIREATEKLRSLGNLETIQEKEMAIGVGIEYPGSGT